MIVSAALFAVFLTAPPLSASTATAAPQTTTASTTQAADKPAPQVDFRQFPQVLASTFTRGLFSRATLPAVGVGAFGTAVVYPFDQRLSDAWAGEAPGLGRAAAIMGGPVVLAGMGSLLVATPFTHNTAVRATSFTLSQAFVLETALTEGLKLAVGRTRPNGSNSYSFPSGHTADTFMAATVLNRYFGLKVGVPAYAIATLVAIGRIESRDHYPSDVVAGAAIGYLSAASAIRAVEHEFDGRVTVAPLIGRRQAGLFVAITF